MILAFLEHFDQKNHLLAALCELSASNREEAVMQMDAKSPGCLQ
jgi:hypothetical protein